MSLRSSRSLLLLLALAAGGCGKKSEAPGAPAKAMAKLPPDLQDATLLGRDLFDVMDAVLSYKASHQGRMPQTLRQLGVDSLTKTTIRRLSVPGGTPAVTAIFRSNEGHQLSSCRGTSEIQEEASLNEGIFSVACATVKGEPVSFKVQGAH